MKFKNLPPYIETSLKPTTPWYRDRTRTLAVIVALLLVAIAVFLLFWYHPWRSDFRNAAADTAGTPVAAGHQAASDSAADSKGDASYSVNVGTTGSDRGGAASIPGNTTVLMPELPNNGTPVTVTIPGEAQKEPATTTTTAPVSTTPTTKPIVSIVVGEPETTTTVVNNNGGSTPTTVAPNSLLNVYAGLNPGVSTTQVSAQVGNLATLTSNVKLGNVTTQIWDTHVAEGHPSTMTLTYINNLLTAKVKVGF